jgi:hypothetical protein
MIVLQLKDVHGLIRGEGETEVKKRYLILLEID